jgi:predicted HNH restriction endonuclease
MEQANRQKNGLPNRKSLSMHLQSVLRDKGGQGKPDEIYEEIAQRTGLTADERQVSDSRGKPLYQSLIRFARADLLEQGVLESPKRGVWRLKEVEIARQELGILNPELFPEGAEAFKEHRTHERNPALVRQAKEQNPLTCQVCAFDFGDSYGDAGAGYIECHHLIPVSELQARHLDGSTLDSVALLCANCHRMAHYNYKTERGRSRLLDLDELRALWKGRR